MVLVLCNRVWTARFCQKTSNNREPFLILKSKIYNIWNSNFYKYILFFQFIDMVPDFTKFFGKISLSRHDSTKPRLSSGSWGQKLYVHIEERHGCPTSGGPALIFQTFHFWSSIALNSVHLLTIQWVQTNQLVKPVRMIPYPTLGSQPTASPSVC